MESGVNANTIKFTASDNYEIIVYYWDKVEKPRAILQIFHGMAEHAERYDRLAKYLNTQGIIVYGDDHRGHGKTSELNGKPGVIGINGFYNIVEDEYMITKMLKVKYPDTPIYVLAHSFGSFVAQEYITKYGNEIAGLILSGSAAQTGPEFKVAKILASIQIKLFGEEKEAKLLEKLSFGSYNKQISNPVSSFDWLSCDAAEVKKYIDDKYCGFICSTGFYYYFSAGLIELYKKTKLDNIPKTLPIYIIAGQQDPVGNYGKSVKKLYDIYNELGISDLNLKLYPDSRHEILNELNKDEVTEDILNWVNSQIKILNT